MGVPECLSDHRFLCIHTRNSMPLLTDNQCCKVEKAKEKAAEDYREEIVLQL